MSATWRRVRMGAMWRLWKEGMWPKNPRLIWPIIQVQKTYYNKIQNKGTKNKS